MIHFVGAGCGAADLITLRGKSLIERADVLIYAGSLINPALLGYARADCARHNSALMTLDQVIAVMAAAEQEHLTTVRLHSGDPCIFGAIREQMDRLDALGVAYDLSPGVSSFCGAAAALKAEYTLPGVSQSVIISRMAGQTPVPQAESIESLARHQATMVIFLSAAMLAELAAALIRGGYDPATPAAIVYKASWPEEKILRGTVADLAQMAEKEQIRKTALVVVGRCLGDAYQLSQLYSPYFATEFREAQQ